jgi:hypothetical protein
MDSERAETFLRLLTEAELRHAAQPDRQRLTEVGEALITVGALDRAAAAAIEADFELAIAAREPRQEPRQAPGTVYRNVYSRPPGRTTAAAAPPSVPGLLVPLDTRLPITSDQWTGELRLLAFLQDTGGAWFAAHARMTGTQPAARPGRWYRPLGMDPARGLSMIDDAGYEYGLGMLSSGSAEPREFPGQMHVQPSPRRRLRWVEIAQLGAPAIRIGLDQATAGPAITVTGVERTPAECLLDQYAAGILASRDRPAALGDILAAMEAAAALPSLSPLPGQLARLCERHGVTGHGISAAPVAEEKLPERWLSDQERPTTPWPQRQAAAAVAALPELDGVRLDIIGVTSSDRSTLLHLHAEDDAMQVLGSGPAFWIRDQRGGWHATHRAGGRTGNGHAFLQLSIWPPLNMASTIDVFACGRSAEVRVTLPLNWG